MAQKLVINGDVRDQPSQGIDREVELGLGQGSACMLSLCIEKQLDSRG